MQSPYRGEVRICTIFTMQFEPFYKQLESKCLYKDIYIVGYSIVLVLMDPNSGELS